jgi:hypothetical protein
MARVHCSRCHLRFRRSARCWLCTGDWAAGFVPVLFSVFHRLLRCGVCRRWDSCFAVAGSVRFGSAFTTVGRIWCAAIRDFSATLDTYRSELDVALVNRSVVHYRASYCRRIYGILCIRVGNQATNRSNQAMELTASRRSTKLTMISTRQYAATRALARGSSSCSR